MFISIRELELHQIQFSEDFRPEAIDFGPDLRQETALHTQGRAELIEEHHGAKGRIEDIRLAGDFSTRMEMRCARCLEPVTRDIRGSFDLLYRPQGTDAGVEDRSVQGTEAEIGYYRGEGLQLEEALREQVLLALPYKTVCRDECRGLCPRCGCNLNNEPCTCAECPADMRWEALKDLRDKLKQ